LSFLYSVKHAASLDDITYSINYYDIANELQNAILLQKFDFLQDLAISVADVLKNLPLLQAILDGLQIQIKITLLKAPLHCKTIGLEYLATFSSDRAWAASKISYFVGNLTCPTIVGINSAERLEAQDVVVNLSIDGQEWDSIQRTRLDLRNLSKMLYEVRSFHILCIHST
jgi:dihydroneopterin aldolase / 2-amino-4-hydroxy-6-hydroxymethyldihydropteridine diphosphokinase / dihydropteroate synthase